MLFHCCFGLYWLYRRLEGVFHLLLLVGTLGLHVQQKVGLLLSNTILPPNPPCILSYYSLMILKLLNWNIILPKVFTKITEKPFGL